MYQFFRVRPHRERGQPRRAAICARGGKTFELYYVRLHLPRQTEGGLTRRTSRDRGGQRTFCVLGTDFPGGQYGMAEELTEKLIEKVRQYVFFVRYKSPGVQKHCEKKLKHGERFLFSLISCIRHRLLSLSQLSANRRSSSSSELGIMN